MPKTGIAIVAAMSLAFAAIHLPQFGTAGALFILFWGAMVTAIRLWTDRSDARPARPLLQQCGGLYPDTVADDGAPVIALGLASS